MRDEFLRDFIVPRAEVHLEILGQGEIEERVEGALVRFVGECFDAAADPVAVLGVPHLFDFEVAEVEGDRATVVGFPFGQHAGAPFRVGEAPAAFGFRLSEDVSPDRHFVEHEGVRELQMKFEFVRSELRVQSNALGVRFGAEVEGVLPTHRVLRRRGQDVEFDRLARYPVELVQQGAVVFVVARGEAVGNDLDRAVVELCQHAGQRDDLFV